jgi:hypothetical protein
MKTVFLHPSEQAAAALFARNITGSVVMLNMLRFRDIADYSTCAELKPSTPISGRNAFQRYVDHTMPFLEQSGGELLFLGHGGAFFIGPEEEHWDAVMLVRQRSLQSFMAFASDAGYLAGVGHRDAALIDSRLLPLVECKRLV